MQDQHKVASNYKQIFFHTPRSHYFVEAHFVAITAAIIFGVCLHQTEMFAYFFLGMVYSGQKVQHWSYLIRESSAMFACL